MQHVRDLVAAEFSAVNDLIIRELHSDVALVENIGHYLIEAGGKRLRPLLVLLTGAASGEVRDSHITFAAVIEFIHSATLLHDDVVDLSTLRRGRATANARWGNAPSVLVGDFLYSRAFQLMVRLGDMQLMALMADTTNTIAEGEVLQLTKAGDPDTTEAAYFEVIERKTAVLFAAAAKGAAILAGLDEATQERLYAYGQHLGTAFQLIDDVLDYQGDAATMGKNVGDDLTEGKPTLPLIYLMQHGTQAQQQLVADAIREKNANQITEIVEAVSTSGALAYTIEQAERQARLAAQNVVGFAKNHYVNALIELTEIAIERRS